MKARIISIAIVAAILTPCAADAQLYFALNAGSQGANFSVTNIAPWVPAVAVIPPPPPRHHHHRHPAPVMLPMRPGFVYDPVAPVRHAYRHAAREIERTVFPPAMFVAPVYYGDYGYYDDDDYEDYCKHYYKHERKRHKKEMKRWRKAMKKHNKEMRRHWRKHHRHHHDD